MEKVSQSLISSRLIYYEINNKDCFASKASIEIMLDRFFNGEKLEFPFSK